MNKQDRLWHKLFPSKTIHHQDMLRTCFVHGNCNYLMPKKILGLCHLWDGSFQKQTIILWFGTEQFDHLNIHNDKINKRIDFIKITYKFFSYFLIIITFFVHIKCSGGITSHFPNQIVCIWNKIHFLKYPSGKQKIK